MLESAFDTNRFIALGANKHNLACVHGGLSLYDAALLAHSTGFNVLGYEVKTLNDNLALFGANFEYFTLLALVVTRDD